MPWRTAADLTHILGNFGECMTPAQIKAALQGQSGDINYAQLVDSLFA